MIDFAEPPRLTNPWFEEELVVVIGRNRPSLVRRLAIPAAMTAVCVTAIALFAQLPTSRPRGTALFAATRNEAEAERILRQVIGVAPTLGGVRTSMASAHVFCRNADGRGPDSLLVCLGDAVRFAEAYTRMAFRFVSRGDSVVRVIVCPAMIASRSSMPSLELREMARPSLSNASCWRDFDNRTHTALTYADLPEAGKFTTVPEPDAPRMRVESASTYDTVQVIW